MFNTGTAFKWAGRGLAGSAASLAGGGEGFFRQWGATGLTGLARGASYMGDSPWARSALMGGAVGGLYGAFSDNTSVLGGMSMGAGVAMGGRGVGRAGRFAGRSFGAGWKFARSEQMGIGQSGWYAMKALANDSAKFIGNKYTNTRQAIRGIPNRVRGWMA
jgi:hypothetical protein